MIEKLVYIIFSIVLFFLKIIPKFLRRSIFVFLEKIAYLFSKKSNTIIENNLKFIYSDNIKEKEIIEVQKYFYYNLILWGQTLVENFNIKDKEIKEMVEVENLSYYEELKKKDKKIIIISAHFGNMEMLSYYINKFITPLVQVARQSKNPNFDKFLVKSREVSGSKIIFRKGALKHLVKAMSQKKVVSLIIDQHTSPKNAIEVNFLGKKVYQTKSTSTLARKFDAVVLPVAIFNQGKDKYKIKFYKGIDPIKTDNENDDLIKHAQIQADVLSNIINEDKKQWFWAHKRFKGFHSEIYK